MEKQNVTDMHQPPSVKQAGVTRDDFDDNVDAAVARLAPAAKDTAKEPRK